MAVGHGRPAELDRIADQIHLSALGERLGHGDFHPARQHLLALKHLSNGVDGPTRHVIRLHPVDQVLFAPGGDLVSQEANHGLPVFKAQWVGGKARIIGQLRNADEITKSPILPVISGRHDDVAIGRLKHLIRHNVGMLIAAAPGFLTGQ